MGTHLMVPTNISQNKINLLVKIICQIKSILLVMLQWVLPQ